MKETALDPHLVDRIVRRVGAFLTENAIEANHLEQVFEMACADDAHRTAVEQALKTIGVRVVRPEISSTEGPRADASHAAEPCESANAPDDCGSAAPAPTARGSRSAPASESDCLEPARLLLRDDRGRRHLSKRLLTAEEEVSLAMLMRGKLPLDEELPKGFRKELHHDDERALAFDSMVLHNWRLVWKISQRFAGQGLEPEDLAQAGYAGLHRAVEKFDASRGLKFSTYATHWINQAIGRAVADEGRLIRLPVWVHERVQRVSAARQRLQMQQRWVTQEDVAAETGFTVEEVDTYARLSAGVVSLELPIGPDEGGTLADLLCDEAHAVADAVAHMEAVWRKEQLEAVLDCLPERQAKIIELRFGLRDDHPRTLDEIGERFGLTRERIRQLQNMALEELKPLLDEVGLRPTG